MKFSPSLNYLLAIMLLLQPVEVFARGFGGRGGGGGGGGGFHGGGGGGGAPHFGGGGGGGARPSFGGGGGGGAHPNFGGGGAGGGARPNFGGAGGGGHANFGGNIGGGSREGFGGGNRPNIGGGNQANFGGLNRPSLPQGNIGRPNIGEPHLPGGNRPNIGGGNIGGGNRPNIGEGGFGGGNRPNIGGGERPGQRPGIPERPGQGGSGERFPGFAGGGNHGPDHPGFGPNRPGFGPDHPGFGPGHPGNFPNNNFNRNNFNHNNNNFIHNNFNNINIATNRPYFNNWQHGNWNGNWNHPGGNGYWNGWAHGWANGYNRGYWNGGWGGYWNHGWGGYWGAPWYAAPIAWGLGAWALGSVMYNSGYMSYSNPYYSGGGGGAAYYDYSQPITVINQQPAATATMVADAAPTPAIQQGTSHTDLAREAFRNGDYATAMSEIDLAIQALPKDAALHEFRALVQFATKDYKQAAATLYAVLSAGPGWDWTTLSSMYADVNTYTNQLRDLETTVKANPSAADARFVLAYQYLTCGHSDAAAKQYKDILQLQPTNQLVSQLLTLVSDDPNAPANSTQATASATDPVPNPPATDDPANQPVPPSSVDPKSVVGNWTAKRSDGSTFGLKIGDDGQFTWDFAQGNNKQQFGGKYKVDGAILVLERNDGAQMPGLITMADMGFNFKMYGGPPDDPGLDFRK